MVLVQIRLLPLYRRTPFGPATWAFAFSYLQAVTLGIRWVHAEHVPGAAALTWSVLILATAAVALLTAWTVVGLARRDFLPVEGDAEAERTGATPASAGT
jgi:tellurite resistance protein